MGPTNFTACFLMINYFCFHAEFADLISSIDPSSGSCASIYTLRGRVQIWKGGLVCWAGRALKRVMSCFGWGEGFVELCVKANRGWGAIWNLRTFFAVRSHCLGSALVWLFWLQLESAIGESSTVTLRARVNRSLVPSHCIPYLLENLRSSFDSFHCFNYALEFNHLRPHTNMINLSFLFLSCCYYYYYYCCYELVRRQMVFSLNLLH